MDHDQLICTVCNDQTAVFGMEDSAEKKLKASEEGEQAVKVVPLLSSYQLTLSQFLGHCVTHYPYQSWCPFCVEGRGREFGRRADVKEPSAARIISYRLLRRR